MTKNQSKTRAGNEHSRRNQRIPQRTRSRTPSHTKQRKGTGGNLSSDTQGFPATTAAHGSAAYAFAQRTTHSIRHRHVFRPVMSDDALPAPPRYRAPLRSTGRKTYARDRPHCAARAGLITSKLGHGAHGTSASCAPRGSPRGVRHASSQTGTLATHLGNAMAEAPGSMQDRRLTATPSPSRDLRLGSGVCSSGSRVRTPKASTSAGPQGTGTD